MAHILHLSDTHGDAEFLRRLGLFAHYAADRGCLPDMVAFTGDVMGSGFDPHELEAFIDFLKVWGEIGVPVVFVPGNHDRPFDTGHLVSSGTRFWLKEHEIKRLMELADEVRQHCHVLINNSILLNGIKIHGLAWQPPFCDWAFNLDHEERKQEISLIHPETEVLLLHSPPHGILDRTENWEEVGDPLVNEALADTGWGVPSPAHTILFGHIHEQGQQSAWRKIGGKWRYFRNGSHVDAGYRPLVDFPDISSNKPEVLFKAISAWNGMIVNTEPQEDLREWVYQLIEDVADDPAYDCAWLLDENYADAMDWLEAFAKTVTFDTRLHRYDSGAITWRANVIRLLADAGRAQIENESGRVVVARPVM